jgi:hypothetical protein
VSRISVIFNWLNLSLAGLSCPLYIGGQVSRIRSCSIQITMSVYDGISYFDYIYAWAYLAGPRSTKIMALIAITLSLWVEEYSKHYRDSSPINDQQSVLENRAGPYAFHKTLRCSVNIVSHSFSLMILDLV